MHGRLAGWARWPGYGRNPLRRRIDRAETAARLMVGVLMLTAVPAAGITVGQFTENRELARAQASAAHSVQAVPLAPAAAVRLPVRQHRGGVGACRWVPPGSPARTGAVLTPAANRKAAGCRPGRMIPVTPSRRRRAAAG